MAILQLLHLPQAALSAWCLYISSIAITNLQNYEEKTEKAAKHSDKVTHELHKTRTTQASGVAAATLSLLTSLALTTTNTLIHPPFWLQYLASPLVLLAILAARAHMTNYWAPKDGKTVGVRVPLPKMESYNQAQRSTEDVLRVLVWLAGTWVCTGVLGVGVGY